MRYLNNNFMLFLFGRIVSDTGTSIQMMILPLYIIDNGGSAVTIGVLSFLSLIPALLVYPLAGVFGDRMNRKRIMITTDFVCAGVTLGLGVLSDWGLMNVSFLLVGQVVLSLMNGLFEPATRGMLPQLVNQDELTRSNSLVASARSAAVLLGPVIGAALYSNGGITGIFFVNGISFLLSGLSEMRIEYVHIKRKAAEGIAGFVDDLLKGARFVFKNKRIRNLCYFLFVVYLVIQPMFSVILPLFFKNHLAYPDTYYGYLQTIIILGALLGSILVGFLFGKEKKVLVPITIGCSILLGSMLLFSVLLFPKSLLIFGEDTSLYFALLAGTLGLFSGANMFINVPMQVFIQKETPEEFMSRVFSFVSMISRAGIPLGALIYGVILERVVMHWVVMITAWLMVVVMVMSIRVLAKGEARY